MSDQAANLPIEISEAKVSDMFNVCGFLLLFDKGS
jgi:hypothetical protein